MSNEYHVELLEFANQDRPGICVQFAHNITSEDAAEAQARRMFETHYRRYDTPAKAMIYAVGEFGQRRFIRPVIADNPA